MLPDARHVVLPKGIASTGFPGVRETCRKIGIEFDSWQVDLNKCILAKTADGLFAADTVVLSIARQVGKTFNIGALVFATCIANPDTTVVWTAHRFKVSRETFNSLRALAKSPKLAPHIEYDDITTAAGNECIPFRNGSRIVFAARERGAIRGFTKVRVLVLDEAQILTDASLADLVPTMNQAENPQIILMGTPPKPTDPGEVFTNLRTDALSGDSEGVLYVEFSAQPGSNPNDREAWKQANPSYPTRTPARGILRMKKTLSDEDFLREGLGIWDASGYGPPISVETWRGLLKEAETVEALRSKAAFGIEVSLDGVASIGAASTMRNGKIALEMVDRRRSTGWVVECCIALKQHRVPFVVDVRGLAAPLVPALEAAGLTVVKAQTPDIAAAFAMLIEAATEGTIIHGPQDELDSAIAGAKARPMGDGPSTFGRKISTADITPLVAVMLAYWGARKIPQAPPQVFSIAEEMAKLQAEQAGTEAETGQPPTKPGVIQRADGSIFTPI